MPLDPDSSIFVAGHRGLVGSALVRRMRTAGFKNLILKTREELDLLEQSQVRKFFQETNPKFVFVAAGRVGGILANDRYGADFLYENMMIEANIIHEAAARGTEKLLFLGSSCVYPKMAPQPLKESSLMTGPLEPTNEGYATAKIAGIRLAQLYQKQYGHKFIAAVPTSVYGPGDDFSPDGSHVVSALLTKFHRAKAEGQASVTLWGTGNPLREFLYVDDLAEALIFLMEKYDSPELINVGGGTEMSIRELAETVKGVVGFKGKIVFDASKPDGAPRKVLDNSKMKAFGWKSKVNMARGLESTYQWALQNGIFP